MKRFKCFIIFYPIISLPGVGWRWHHILAIQVKVIHELHYFISKFIRQFTYFHLQVSFSPSKIHLRFCKLLWENANGEYPLSNYSNSQVMLFINEAIEECWKFFQILRLFMIFRQIRWEYSALADCPSSVDTQTLESCFTTTSSEDENCSKLSGRLVIRKSGTLKPRLMSICLALFSQESI